MRIFILFCYADEDEPLFMSLVTDLFPNQTLEKTAYPELEEAILAEVEKAGLIYHPPWVLKLIQVMRKQLSIFIVVDHCTFHFKSFIYRE